MELLEVGVKEDPYCPRNSFYYARELTFYERHDEAIVELNRYLALPLALWNHERAFAMRLIGQSMFGKGEDGTPWYRKAVIEAPEVREPWVELANACYKTSRWEECYSAACTALKITERQYNYTAKPESWGSLPHDLAAIAAYRMGLKDRALGTHRFAQVTVESKFLILLCHDYSPFAAAVCSRRALAVITSSADRVSTRRF